MSVEFLQSLGNLKSEKCVKWLPDMVTRGLDAVRLYFEEKYSTKLSTVLSGSPWSTEIRC